MTSRRRVPLRAHRPRRSGPPRDPESPPVRAWSGEARLRVRAVSVRFGGAHALDQVDLDVGPGEVVSLIGPNGAGKTTLFNVVSGLVAPDEGSVDLDGSTLEGESTAARARRGVTRTFQRMELFEELTVLENLVVVEEYLLRRPLELLRGVVTGDDALAGHVADAEEILAFLGIGNVASVLVSEVSSAVRRLVELGRVLVTPARLTLLDEPSSGLDRPETARFVEVIRQLRASEPDRSLLIVEHDMSVALELADWVYVLDFGTIIASGPPTLIRENPEVQRAYLGTKIDA